MRPARVLHVFKYFRPRFTGEGVFVERLAPVFARLRSDVRHEVLVLATPRPHTPMVLPGLDAVHYLSRSEGDASQAALVSWLARHARRYAVVHHRTHVDRTFAGAAALKLQGVRTLLSATLDDSVEGLLATYRPALRPLALRLFGLIDGFVAISPRLHAENLRRAPPDRCALVPMGVPLPRPAAEDRAAARRRLNLPADATVLVCVGGLCRRKDQALLVREIAPLARRRPKLTLLLVGPVVEADYATELRRQVTAHGLDTQVRFEGHVEDPSRHYRAADVFVFASRQEGFGTVMIEAMAHGLPVVARSLPGVNDFIAHGRTGLVFEQDGDFAATLQRLLDDPVLRAKLGRAAREQAQAYDIEAVAARYLELYGYPAEVAAPSAALDASHLLGTPLGGLPTIRGEPRTA
jgi:glycosyltransferase involved in cell wall biosynthesis